MQENKDLLKLPEITLSVDPAGESDKDCVMWVDNEVIEYSNPYAALKDARAVIRAAKRLISSLERDIENVEFLAL